MKRLLNVFFILFFCLLFVGCENETLYSYKEVDVHKTLLKERDSNYPWQSYKKEKSILSKSCNSRTVLTFNDYLGRSYKDTEYPFESAQNVGFPIIDIEKLARDYPSYIAVKYLGEGEANSFAYSDFSRYTVNSTISKKIDTGYSLNLGLFKIGSKKKMSEVFSSSKIEESKRVFGELNVTIKDASYSLQMSSNIKKKIMLNYLSKDFVEELYNTMPSELFSNYGGFVLSGFVTGGRAVALYTGLYESEDLVTNKEKNMNKDISASYGFKNNPNDNISGNLGIGKGFSNGESSSGKISAMETSVKTIGGSPEFASFSIPQSIDNININLSGWMSSLNNKNTHSIIEFVNGGLIPIVDFIMEDNLKKALLNCYESKVNTLSRLQEPYINIRLCYVSGVLGTVETGLITRFNDDILLKMETLYMAEIGDYIQRETARVSGLCGLKIINNNKLDYKVKIDFRDIDEAKMVKYIDSTNNTIYLLYSVGDKKYGYSIHTDRILDDYVMRSFVNRLPSTTIDPFDLFNYVIVAL
ncbi:MAC/perforin domain-containing protein [Gemella morbillorum]